MITAKEMYEEASKAYACEEALDWLQSLPENDNPLDYDHPKKAEWAYWYARWIIRGKWKEAEPYIMKDPEWAFWYAKQVIKGRWKEAEPHIMKDPRYAYLYAEFVIKGRWSEAEPHIMTNSYWSDRYNNFVEGHYDYR